jgi:hypothetical protein
VTGRGRSARRGLAVAHQLPRTSWESEDTRGCANDGLAVAHSLRARPGRASTRAAARMRTRGSSTRPLTTASRTTFAPSPRPAGVLPPGRAIYLVERPRGTAFAGPRVDACAGSRGEIQGTAFAGRALTPARGIAPGHARFTAVLADRPRRTGSGTARPRCREGRRRARPGRRPVAPKTKPSVSTVTRGDSPTSRLRLKHRSV